MSIILLIFQYLPAILQGIMALEKALPQASGATKKTVLMDVLTNNVAPGTIPATHVPIISKLIDTLVSSLNATGVMASVAADVMPSLPTPAVKPAAQ